MEWCVSMIGKIVQHFNLTEASKMIVIGVFVGVPIASLLHVYPKSLMSLALLLFYHRRHQALHYHRCHHHNNVDMEDQEAQEEIGLGAIEMDCAVCLCPVSRGERFRLLSCDHGFHDHCIEAWLQSCSTCPLCRNPVMGYNDPNSDQHLQQHFHDGVVCWIFSVFEKLCKWMESPLNSELVSAFIENSNNYLGKCNRFWF